MNVQETVTPQKADVGWGKLIYKLFHPLLILIISPLLTAFVMDALAQTAGWVAIVTVAFAIPIYFVYQNFSKRWPQTEANKRVSVVAMILIIMIVTIANFFSLPTGLAYCFYTALVGGVSIAIVSRVVPISPHAVMLAGCATTTTLLAPTMGLLLVPICLASSWAVYQLNYSTIKESVTSWIVLTVSAIAVFMMVAPLS